jgi:hypothetical protein
MQPERNPSAPSPAASQSAGTPAHGATPGIAASPKADDTKPEPEALKPEDAKALLHAGHKLRKKGDPPEKWIAFVRVGGKLAKATPLDEEEEEKLAKEQLVLSE